MVFDHTIIETSGLRWRSAGYQHWPLLKVDYGISVRNKGQKLGRFLIVVPLKCTVDYQNGKIDRKMASGQLLFLAL